MHSKLITNISAARGGSCVLRTPYSGFRKTREIVCESNMLHVIIVDVTLDIQTVAEICWRTWSIFRLLISFHFI